MDSGQRYIIFSTPQGWVGALSSSLGLLRITVPQSTFQLALESLGEKAKDAIWSPNSFSDLVASLTMYFSGEKTVFQYQLDLSQATPFQRQVWEATYLIPYGETRSYAWVADRIGKPAAFRAVGQALGRNPLAIIVPCHRVIASDGGLGGFGGGLEMKRFLLQLERVMLS